MPKLSQLIFGVCSVTIWVCLTLPAYAIDLPPEAQRDMYVISLANHLKAEEWSKAYPYFEKLEMLNRKHKLKSDLAVVYYRGEVTYHLEKYAEAEKYLGHYIRKAGSKGSYYTQSLQLLSQVETKKAVQLAEYLRKGKSHDWQSFVKAEPWFRKAAQLGSAYAQERLGTYYRTGTRDGIKKDLAESLKWTQMAVNQNYPKAINRLAQMYRYGLGVPKDVNKAIQLYAKSYALLDKGKNVDDIRASIGAALAVAGMYTTSWKKKNRDVPYDRDKALSWYKKAAFDAQGNIISYAKGGLPARGAEKLADYYLYSGDWLEKEKNYGEAIKLYRLAANEDCVKGFCANSKSARIKLSRLYLFGTLHGNSVVGVVAQEKVDARKNEDRGIKLAKRVKSVEAYFLLADYYYRRAETKNYAEAIKYYSLITKEKARLAKGSSNQRRWLAIAFFKLAQIYEQGQGVNADFVKAASFYKQHIPFESNSALKGFSASQLGIFYLEGKGVKKDYQEAIKWFKKAPRHFGARFRLAGMYAKGLGIKFAERNKYKSEAYKIYQKLVWAKNPGVFYARENPYLNDDEFTQAKKALDRLAKYRPETIIEKYEKEFITTASGLRYLILEKGEGTTHPKPTDTVTLYYVAKLTYDREIYPAPKKDKAISIKLEGTLAGFSEGVQLMSSGDKAILVLPPLKERKGSFPANTPIIFELTLVKFEN